MKWEKRNQKVPLATDSTWKLKISFLLQMPLFADLFLVVVVVWGVNIAICTFLFHQKMELL